MVVERVVRVVRAVRFDLVVFVVYVSRLGTLCCGFAAGEQSCMIYWYRSMTYSSSFILRILSRLTCAMVIFPFRLPNSSLSSGVPLPLSLVSSPFVSDRCAAL